MSDSESAAAFAISLARKRGSDEIGPDELLLGCLQTRSQFGIVELGTWRFDLEELGVDWLEAPGTRTPTLAYSPGAVEIFDRAARIARADGAKTMRVDHLLAAFAAEDSGLMGDLKAKHGITSAAWRAALGTGVRRSERGGQVRETVAEPAEGSGEGSAAEYLTPEEAAEALGVHVQTLRAYVRSGKLPALRLAGERAIRIRRGDLEKVFERVQPGKESEPKTGT
ncbi:MAG TPA: helix-turn-helix domain-containing protein [Verrucomicrobiae bacterium]|nr:helix-turn-helix domain-containing protein [Verrucomicrobiae bacterium]